MFISILIDLLYNKYIKTNINNNIRDLNSNLNLFVHNNIIIGTISIIVKQDKINTLSKSFFLYKIILTYKYNTGIIINTYPIDGFNLVNLK